MRLPKFARYGLIAISAFSIFAFIATAINVYTIQRDQGTTLSESINIHLIAKGRGIFGSQQISTRGALSYTISPAPPVPLGTQPILTFDNVQGGFMVPLELTITVPPESGVTMTNTRFQMLFDPSTNTFSEHPPIILSSATAGEKRISVNIRELGRHPNASEPRRQFLVIPVEFVESVGLLGLSAAVVEIVKNISAAIGVPALFLLWLESRQRRRDEETAKRRRIILPGDR